MISIIIPFRNREKKRILNSFDSLAIQTFRDFEVIFVDYGSNLDVSTAIKPLVESYSFCRYVYNETRGLPWNRAHALNSGAKLAKGDCLFFSDVDLIFSAGFLEMLSLLDTRQRHYYTRVYLLPEKFFEWSSLTYGKIKNLTLTPTSGRGILFIRRDSFLNVGGYDEFYRDWGIEDNDLFDRLQNAGFKDGWANYVDFPVYHQWHSSSRTFKIPRWFDEMVVYSFFNKNRIHPKGEIGELLSIGNRPALIAYGEKKFMFTLEIKESGDNMRRRQYFSEILELIQNAKSGESIHLIINKRIRNYSLFHKTFLFLVSYILKKSRSDYVLEIQKSAQPEFFFDAPRDINWLIRKLIVFEKCLEDTFQHETTEKISFCLIKK